MTEETYDIIIVGAGPAGCSCAHQLSGKGLKIAIIDKDIFPRDKICGDAISPDVVNQFYRMDAKLGEQFKQFPIKKGSHGIRFFAPNHNFLDLSFTKSKYTDSASFVVKRIAFDNFFFNQIKDLPDIAIYLNHKVQEISISDEAVVVETDKKAIKGKMIIGADGANSVVKKRLLDNKIEREHHSAGLRQYYENVTGFHEKNHIELHFYEGILPGYFWIFPLPDNQANIGIGMLSSEVSKRKINLKEKLADIIQHHPNVKDRFKDAKPLEPVRGFGLPMGSKKRACSGNRSLLLGDAASLIDPFSGEGIGNAMRSGRIAADHILKAVELNRFDAKFNKLYDKEIYSKMWKEFRFSYYLRKLMKHPRIFNFLLNKGSQSKAVRILLTSILDNRDFKKSIISPSFYYKLLSSSFYK
ncbi:MAG: geranylgeranyl reductase family protein [Saprospiraceae bacterium]|jgi:geranylgeranyl reductase family protein